MNKMSKTLVVYYSLTGNTRLIAEAIKENINADILGLKPVKELKANSSMKYMWGGAQATMKKKPKLEDFSIDPLAYDLIFIGTPVWAWTLSPPIRTFLSQFDFTGKKVALWACAGGNGIKAMERFKEAIKDAIILGDIRFQEPLTKAPEEAKQKAITWAKDILKTEKIECET
jgi:flavodoxin